MTGQVNIVEFVNYLRDNNLLIVSKNEYEAKIDYKRIALEKFQKKLLNKESLTVNEIVRGQLLPVKTRQSVNNWIDGGIFDDDEVWVDKEGKRRVITSAIHRVRRLKNYEL